MLTDPLPAPSPATLATAEAPGRSCPLHYRYRPEALAGPVPADWQGLEVLYVVGGLYGNDLALDQVLALFEQETGRKRLLFNGDFHWFDRDPAVFARVQQAVLAHHALRGNVETELATGAPADGAGDAGCGCAYPDWVGEGVVERSNRILTQLRSASTARQQAALAALPMWQRAEVGGLPLAIVHGDATSLAGWGFAQEHLRQPAHRAEVATWFERAEVQAFACSHTCLPVFQALHRAAWAAPRWVLNNGAAGMGNFRGDTAGLLTRIATRPFTGAQRRHAVAVAPGVLAEAIALPVDPAALRARFLAQWPPGSDAHVSYFERLTQGPAYDAADALRPLG